MSFPIASTAAAAAAASSTSPPPPAPASASSSSSSLAFQAVSPSVLLPSPCESLYAACFEDVRGWGAGLARVAEMVHPNAWEGVEDEGDDDDDDEDDEEEEAYGHRKRSRWGYRKKPGGRLPPALVALMLRTFERFCDLCALPLGADSVAAQSGVIHVLNSSPLPLPEGARGELVKHSVSEGTKAVQKAGAGHALGHSDDDGGDSDDGYGSGAEAAQAADLAHLREAAQLVVPMVYQERGPDCTRPRAQMRPGARAYLSGVCEYLAAEVLELAGNIGLPFTVDHAQQAVQADEELCICVCRLGLGDAWGVDAETQTMFARVQASKMDLAYPRTQRRLEQLLERFAWHARPESAQATVQSLLASITAGWSVASSSIPAPPDADATGSASSPPVCDSALVAAGYADDSQKRKRIGDAPAAAVGIKAGLGVESAQVTLQADSSTATTTDSPLKRSRVHQASSIPSPANVSTLAPTASALLSPALRAAIRPVRYLGRRPHAQWFPFALSMEEKDCLESIGPLAASQLAPHRAFDAFTFDLVDAAGHEWPLLWERRPDVPAHVAARFEPAGVRLMAGALLDARTRQVVASIRATGSQRAELQLHSVSFWAAFVPHGPAALPASLLASALGQLQPATSTRRAPHPVVDWWTCRYVQVQTGAEYAPRPDDTDAATRAQVATAAIVHAELSSLLCIASILGSVWVPEEATLWTAHATAALSPFTLSLLRAAFDSPDVMPRDGGQRRHMPNDLLSLIADYGPCELPWVPLDASRPHPPAAAAAAPSVDAERAAVGESVAGISAAATAAAAFALGLDDDAFSDSDDAPSAAAASAAAASSSTVAAPFASAAESVSAAAAVSAFRDARGRLFSFHHCATLEAPAVAEQ